MVILAVELEQTCVQMSPVVDTGGQLVAMATPVSYAGGGSLSAHTGEMHIIQDVHSWRKWASPLPFPSNFFHYTLSLFFSVSSLPLTGFHTGFLVWWDKL